MRAFELSLDGRIYRPAALRETALAFAHLARVTVRKQGTRYRVRIEPHDKAVPKTISDEYANYALALTVRKQRE
jgi:hypothetical protein